MKLFILLASVSACCAFDTTTASIPYRHHTADLGDYFLTTRIHKLSLTGAPTALPSVQIARHEGAVYRRNRHDDGDDDDDDDDDKRDNPHFASTKPHVDAPSATPAPSNKNKMVSTPVASSPAVLNTGTLKRPSTTITSTTRMINSTHPTGASSAFPPFHPTSTAGPGNDYTAEKAELAAVVAAHEKSTTQSAHPYPTTQGGYNNIHSQQQPPLEAGGNGRKAPADAGMVNHDSEPADLHTRPPNGGQATWVIVAVVELLIILGLAGWLGYSTWKRKKAAREGSYA